jgi:hypothetical protein
MFKKEKIKFFCMGVIATLIFSSSTLVFANSIQKNISVFYDKIKIIIDGKQITPRDAKGNLVEPFVYNGTTYVPVRAISEALGNDVSWDNQLKAVVINTVEPFSLLKVQMDYQATLSSSDLAESFNKERKRLGSNFEAELMKFTSNNIEFSYWASAFLIEPEYLNGNPPLYDLFLKVTDNAIKLCQENPESEHYYLIYSLNVNAALYSQIYGNETYAIRYKKQAEEILKSNPILEGAWPAMAEEDEQLYKAIPTN